MKGDDLIETCIMPVNEKNIDLRALYLKLNRWTIDRAFVEKVHAMPGQGVSSMFKFGWGLGAIEATLTCLCIPYTLTHSSVWTRHIHKDIDAENSKQKSAIAAAQLYPAHNFLKSARSRKPHDGMIDAALIAKHGSFLIKSLGIVCPE